MSVLDIKKIAEIDPDTLERLKDKYRSDPDIRERTELDATEFEVTQTIRRDAGRELFGDRPDLKSLATILRERPEIFSGFEVFERSFFRLKWPERVRLSSPEELAFLERVRDIGSGKFLEVMQVTALTPSGQVEVSYDVSGGMEVNKQTIQRLLDSFKSLNVASEVIIIHPHPDEYALTRLEGDITIDESVPALLHGGGISSDDVKLADDVLRERCHENCRVEILAINERGITFSYVAGTSSKREWPPKAEVD